MSRGELFITGRIKDMIIRGGRNIHPTELESIIEQIEGVRRGCVACFGDTDAAGTERLVIAAETHASGESSGKIRRSDTRELYRRGRLADPSPLRARQFLTLAALAVGARLRIARVFVRTYAYSGYAWSWLYLLGGMMWLAVVLLPTRRARWRAMRAGCRAFCFLCGIRLSVTGLERLPATGNWVLACNHTSYLDSMMLLQAMPRDLTFVAKRALNRRWIQRIFLRRLGTVFVKRRDPRDSAPALDELSSRLRAGECLAVFPEGTFVRESRLLPLRLGAFLAAARTGVPVVPTGIEGVRDIMRSESWLIRRADVRLEVTAPIEPRGDTLRDAAALRAETRRRLRELLDTTRAARARSR